MCDQSGDKHARRIVGAIHRNAALCCRVDTCIVHDSNLTSARCIDDRCGARATPIAVRRRYREFDFWAGDWS
jgi:hypothetical protein